MHTIHRFYISTILHVRRGQKISSWLCKSTLSPIVGEKGGGHGEDFAAFLNCEYLGQKQRDSDTKADWGWVGGWGGCSGTSFRLRGHRVWMEPLLLHRSGTQGMNTAVTTRLLLSPATKFSGAGKSEAWQTATVFSLWDSEAMWKAGPLAKPCPNQLESSESLLTQSFGSNPCWRGSELRAHCACMAQTKGERRHAPCTLFLDLLLLRSLHFFTSHWDFVSYMLHLAWEQNLGD